MYAIRSYYARRADAALHEQVRLERRRVGSTINTVRAEEIEASREPNLVSALAGKAPNVEVTSSTGDPGGGAYIRIRNNFV